jgi:hypothetical protein
VDLVDLDSLQVHLYQPADLARLAWCYLAIGRSREECRAGCDGILRRG